MNNAHDTNNNEEFSRLCSGAVGSRKKDITLTFERYITTDAKRHQTGSVKIKIDVFKKRNLV